ncbi:MAG TPA: class I SAM-dependent methyltransferase, partial [Acidimicrobiales bacterium]|nr:class I SAM-dependent methyltransferase [Acidimicrobiales bacterium]
MSRAEELLALARGVRGFMPEPEGRALYELARDCARPRGTWLELGAWCGKSTVYLGAAAEEAGALLYSLDHHRGSEETQAGWEHFDPAVVGADGRIDTLPHWRATLAAAGLEGSVVGLVGESTAVAAHFAQPLDLLFLDGGHGEAVAWADWRAWSPKVAAGGLLLIHDVFADPADGGRPPYEIFQAALDEGFAEVSAVGSLRALV